MIILDTDCVSLLQRENILLGSHLQNTLDKFPKEEICTTIITFEEQIYAYINNFRESLVIDFDEKAAEVFQNLKSNKIRVGTMDLKIASIAIANDAILVSRNLADFEQIPDLQVEDQTK